MTFSFVHVLVVVVATAAAAVFWLMPPRQSIPGHLKGHPLVDMGQGFLDADTVEGLLQMTRDYGKISAASREYDVYSTTNDNIGEAVPFDKKTMSTCPESYLMPNGDMTKCVFPGRVDVGRHYIMSGGPEGVKEDFATLASRAQPFQGILFNWSKFEVADKLMKDEKFIGLAKAVCPKDKQFLDPFQFNLVVQVPGQTVAAHIDAPVFFRATRRTAPQWLMAAMVFSGLFKEEFVEQVQLVGYYHKWTDAARGGKFYFWNDDNAHPHVSDPVSGSANSVDGSKVVHAAAVYMPERKPPLLRKDDRNELVYAGKDASTGEHLWTIHVNGEPKYNYREDEIRFSAVYRARCFKHKEAREAFLDDSQNRPWSIDHILTVFEQDLKKRGRWPFGADETAVRRNSPKDRYQLGLALLDTYIKYPFSPTAAIPVNYCALDRIVPVVKPLLSLIC